ncbi:flagellin N-terminal helical domain-containing protein [Candidatus Solirubrobacter pratensis]|uniref:flagellin N-terminal helical domain-containing protein n=1 Tax=Candidatus Solirubrobacter pratensis TaxID=1298857 RepID=UPI000415BA35|nr:flagellin [Candidatus Solirubrobacter pratensis]
MSLRIQNNVEAFNAHRQLSGTAAKAAKAMEKLSSGYRINRAADDAAGLAISEKMRSQIGGLDQAQRNAQDGVSLVQTGEGALNEVHSMLQRVRDLKVQYSNGTLDNDDKSAISAEVQQLGKEISDITKNTEFNGIKLLSGGGDVTLQVGAGSADTITLTATEMSGAVGTAGTGGLQEITDIGSAGTVAAADTAFAALSLDNIDDAIKNVSSARSTFGAVQNRLEHRLNNLSTYQENLVASESRIRDVDMASEMVNFTKLNILQQAGTSMLSQANQAPQNVLSLLR